MITDIVLRLLDRQGITKVRLAQELDMTKGYLSKILSKDGQFSYNHIITIARFFNIGIEELFNKELIGNTCKSVGLCNFGKCIYDCIELDDFLFKPVFEDKVKRISGYIVYIAADISNYRVSNVVKTVGFLNHISLLKGSTSIDGVRLNEGDIQTLDMHSIITIKEGSVIYMVLNDMDVDRLFSRIREYKNNMRASNVDEIIGIVKRNRMSMMAG